MSDENTESTYADRQRSRDDAYRSTYREWVDGLPEDEAAQLKELGLHEPRIDAQGAGGPELDEQRLPDEVWEPFSGEDDTAPPDDAPAFPPHRGTLQESLRIMVGSLRESDDPARLAAVYSVALRCARPSPAEVRVKFGMDATQLRNERDAAVVELELQPGDMAALRKVCGEITATPNIRLSVEVLELVSGVCYEGASQTQIATRHNITRAAVSKRCVRMCERLGLPPSRSMKSEGAREIYASAQEKAWQTSRG